MDIVQIVWIGLGVVLVGVAFSACFVIKQQSIGIIERFGRFKGLALPGLNIRLPLVDRLVGHVNLRIQQLDVHVETKTKDNVFVGIQVSVQYQAIPSKIYATFKFKVQQSVNFC